MVLDRDHIVVTGESLLSFGLGRGRKSQQLGGRWTRSPFAVTSPVCALELALHALRVLNDFNVFGQVPRFEGGVEGLHQFRLDIPPLDAAVVGREPEVECLLLGRVDPGAQAHRGSGDHVPDFVLAALKLDHRQSGFAVVADRTDGPAEVEGVHRHVSSPGRFSSHEATHCLGM